MFCFFAVGARLVLPEICLGNGACLQLAVSDGTSKVVVSLFIVCGHFIRGAAALVVLPPEKKQKKNKKTVLCVGT